MNRKAILDRAVNVYLPDLLVGKTVLIQYNSPGFCNIFGLYEIIQVSHSADLQVTIMFRADHDIDGLAQRCVRLSIDKVKGILVEY